MRPQPSSPGAMVCIWIVLFQLHVLACLVSRWGPIGQVRPLWQAGAWLVFLGYSHLGHLGVRASPDSSLSHFLSGFLRCEEALVCPHCRSYHCDFPAMTNSNCEPQPCFSPLSCFCQTLCSNGVFLRRQRCQALISQIFPPIINPCRKCYRPTQMCAPLMH